MLLMVGHPSNKDSVIDIITLPSEPYYLGCLSKTPVAGATLCLLITLHYHYKIFGGFYNTPPLCPGNESNIQLLDVDSPLQSCEFVCCSRYLENIDKWLGV